MKRIKAVLCGNPNVGKSTVFNALTGLKQHTGNWAGKTVDSAMGVVRDQEREWELIDLPGAYSLLNGSPDEMVTADYLLMRDYDVAVIVCDATCLSRSMVLALQVISICRKAVVCINMMDEAAKEGIIVDTNTLEQRIGVPVIGISARKGQGIHRLKEAVRCCVSKQGLGVPCCENKENQAMDEILQPLKSILPNPGDEETYPPAKNRLLSLRLLLSGQAAEAYAEMHPAAKETIIAIRKQVLSEETVIRNWIGQAIERDYQEADALVAQCIRKGGTSQYTQRRLRIDKMLCSPWTGIPLMFLLLVVLFYLTMYGANAPSEWLSSVLFGFEDTLCQWFRHMSVSEWLIDAFVHGMYRTVAWVVAVMLPPMAIFFPLFTLLEDLGYLPRIAFNMDRCFHCCHTCGKQVLCMCMGLGCNAVGVTGCRIIQSPRERMIAILTNAITPCNGRLPFLMTLITTFLITAGTGWGSVLSAVVLAGFLLLSVLVTLTLSWGLSKTILKGVESTFVLELPPFRKPKTVQIIIRSIIDRTATVLLRAVSVAAPAGLLLWLFGYISFNGVSLLQYAARFLNPVGHLLGMDGVILLAFVLGLPANEIVLPIALMIYLAQNQLTEPMQSTTLRMVLEQNGWTWITALCTAMFSMFHWPCSTTILTVYKETKQLKWTVLAIVLPTVAGILVCMLTGMICKGI